MSPFTSFVEDCIKRIENPKDKLFKIGTNGAYKIVRHITGNGVIGLEVKEKAGMEKSSNIFALKDYVGVVDAQVLSDCVKTDWREYRKAILGRAK